MSLFFFVTHVLSFLTRWSCYASTVLLTTDGHVKVADLGLARNFKNTVVTAGIGTPAFMPTEAFDDRLAGKKASRRAT